MKLKTVRLHCADYALQQDQHQGAREGGEVKERFAEGRGAQLY